MPLDATSNSYPVLISGYYGFDNLGDEAILESILQWFESRDDVHPVVLSNKPEKTIKSYGVDSIPRASFFPLIRKIAGSPLLLQGGGGLLQDVTSGRSLTYYLSILLLGLVTGRKVAVFGQGIGPLEGEFSEYFVGEFLSQCDLVCVRDFKSYSMCQSRLPVNANLHLMADTALLLEPADAETVDEIFLKENLDLVGKPLIGWSIKGSMRDKRQINALARAIDLTINAIDCGVAIFPFHHPDDLQYAETVRMLLENKDQVEIVKEVYRPRDVLGLIGKCDMVVGMRLHSLVFAANRSVPFVSVSYDPKIDEFSREFGISPAVHTPLVGPEVLVEKIEDMWELRGRMRTKVTDTMKRLRGRATDGFRALGDFVDSLQLKRLRAASKVKKLSAGKSEK